MIEIHPVTGIGEITDGEDLAALIAGAIALQDGDVLVVTQKVVSKAEGRSVSAADKAAAIAGETKRVLRKQGGMTIAETHHGFVCANAGVDSSNVPGDRLVLLPRDPDASARRLRSRLGHIAGADVAVIVSDTFGRAWRLGQTDIAIGVAGMLAFLDHVGHPDTEGKIMHATRICVADELASAAELVMGKTSGICAAVIRGAEVPRGRGAAVDIVRPPENDLFR